MTLFDFLFLILVAGLCGSIAQALVGFSRGGCLVSIAVGFIGALFGTWMARAFGLPDILELRFDDHPFPVVWSIVGGSLFVAVLSLLSGRGSRR